VRKINLYLSISPVFGTAASTHKNLSPPFSSNSNQSIIVSSNEHAMDNIPHTYPLPPYAEHHNRKPWRVKRGDKIYHQMHEDLLSKYIWHIANQLTGKTPQLPRPVQTPFYRIFSPPLVPHQRHSLLLRPHVISLLLDGSDPFHQSPSIGRRLSFAERRDHHFAETQFAACGNVRSSTLLSCEISSLDFGQLS
jgi:hypothetical protein